MGDNRSFSNIVLLQNFPEQILKSEILHPFFASIPKNEPPVLHIELTPTVVRSIRIEAKVQKNRATLLSLVLLLKTIAL